MITERILPCPFCGGPASVEELGASFSVGCCNRDEAARLGYQSLTVFATRSEAVAAWNRRHLPSPLEQGRRAGFLDEPRDGCPYSPENMVARAEWFIGWRRGWEEATDLVHDKRAISTR